MFSVIRRQYSNVTNIPRFVELVDVCIVGGGPAGLATAIKFKQIDKEHKYRIVVLEKSADFGNHIVSGCVVDPRALKELFPGDFLPCKNLLTPVTKDDFKLLLNKKLSLSVPIPSDLRNKGKNYICSLSQLTKWLSEQAESLGVELYPGVAVSDIIYDKDQKSVLGVATRDLGLDKDGQPRDNCFERGLQFHSRQTVFSEGCRGSLSKQLIKHFKLYQNNDPKFQGQTYGIGIKEIWKVDPSKFKPGYTSHTIGYPLSYDTYGGGFQYHFGDNLVTVGLVIGLDYKNPYISPYQEFQKLKHHPYYTNVLKGGKCIGYGARALNEGGLQSIPSKVTFPGGVLVGDSIGYMNVPKIKGSHTAMKSGIVAAEEIFKDLEAKQFKTMNSLIQECETANIELDSNNIIEFLKQRDNGSSVLELSSYENSIKKSWIWDELYKVRNVRPSFNNKLGMYGGMIYSGLDTMFLKGRVPWTFSHHTKDGKYVSDGEITDVASKFKKIEYPKPDNVISFDIMTSISRTGTYHDHEEPCHLRIGKRQDLIEHAKKSWPKWEGIEQRYCPAGVYEYDDEGKFKINSQNCIHCKTCDIKDPTGDTNWVVPEGSDGPKYSST